MDKEAALHERFGQDLFIVQLTSSGEWQVCDGNGRDGYVLAKGATRKLAVSAAYKKYIAKHG